MLSWRLQPVPGIEPLRDLLVKILDENLIDSVTFKQWTNVDRSTLETLFMSSDEFIDLLCDKLEALRSHSFIATQQSQYYEECKVSLKSGEVAVTADFSENYAFVLQDAAQGFHWNISPLYTLLLCISRRQTALFIAALLSFQIACNTIPSQFTFSRRS